jgi:pfkB family carbohydrate kinase
MVKDFSSCVEMKICVPALQSLRGFTGLSPIGNSRQLSAAKPMKCFPLSLLLFECPEPSGMIICISANPALDRRVWLRSLRSGKIHRARAAAVASGGKAAHVAMVARSLGEAVLWIAMTGGATGDDCRCDLASMGIRTVTVKAQGVTRTNLELIEEESGQHTEIRETGDPVSASEVAEFVQCCREQLRNASGSCVVLSGSLPPGVSSDLYRRLIAEIHLFDRLLCWIRAAKHCRRP